MEWLTDYHIWASFFSLAALEIVLGIDNVVFIALLVNHLPEKQRHIARTTGLMLALLMRIVLLFGVVWVIGLKEPWITLFGVTFSGKDILMFLGGLFLLSKATSSIHDEVTGDRKESYNKYTAGFAWTIIQLVLLDFVFSFDSVITAVGLTDNINVIIAAMVVAMIVMLLSSQFISGFIEKHPTFKMLALAFVMMIGAFLVAEGMGLQVPKGYIYFAMIFSLSIECLNMLVRHRKKTKQ